MPEKIDDNNTTQAINCGLHYLLRSMQGVFKGGSNPPPKIFRFFLKGEGKEVERKREKK